MQSLFAKPEATRSVAAPRISAWRVASAALAVVFLATLAVIATLVVPRYYELNSTVATLNAEVAHLRQEQTMPSVVLQRHRDSICYIYASYVIDRPEGMEGPEQVQFRMAGSGFVVADGLIATNRHVLQPLGGDANGYLKAGGQARLQKLVAYFPGLQQPVFLHGIEFSRTADLAVAHFDSPQDAAPMAPLPLTAHAPTPGDSIVVIGYPLGAIGMAAKSPEAVYEKLALRPESIDVVDNLASMSLIRPSATYGHVGDVVGDKLIYDAPTAHGGSGGPVFNSLGEVVAVNTAYMNGFAGGTIGFSVSELRSLVARAQSRPR